MSGQLGEKVKEKRSAAFDGCAPLFICGLSLTFDFTLFPSAYTAATFAPSELCSWT
jgi:hypothetical protein